MQQIRSQMWLLALFPLLLGGIIFMTTLTDSTLWADEGWTIFATNSPNPITILEDWVNVDVHPPLYFIALGIWRIFTGDTILEMRYFSVLVTLLGIALIYRAGTDIFNRRTGLIASIFFALHDLVKVLTQEVRHYPGQLTITILILWLYWRFQEKPTLKRGCWFIVGGACALYIHYWTAFILLACGLHALIVHFNNRQTLYRVIGAGVAIGGLFLFWIPVLVHQITFERPQGLPHALENTLYVYRVLLFQLVGTPEVFWLVLIGAGLIGTWSLTPRRWYPSSASWLLLFAIITPPALTIAMNLIYPILSFRALAVIVPPVMLLSAYGLSRFRVPEGNIILLFIVLFSLTNTAADTFMRPNWQEIAETITTQSTASDILLIENDTDEYSLAYYIQQTGREIDYYHSEHVRLFTPDDYPAFLDDALSGAEGVWVTMLNWAGFRHDIRPELAQYGFQQSAPEIDYGRYDNRPILLWRFDRIPNTPPRAIFGDELILHRAETQVNADTLTVNLLWEADVIPSQEYVVSILLFGAEGISNQDSTPLEGRSPTSTWEAGQRYFDSHSIEIASLSAGIYQVGIQVYWFTDGTYTQTQNLTVDDCSDDEQCRFILIDQIAITD